MNGMRMLKQFVVATGILFLMATEALAVAREPLVLPTSATPSTLHMTPYGMPA